MDVVKTQTVVETPKSNVPSGEKNKGLPSSMQKICGVCGDKALGYNFNAVSCESCKAFFRRNALTGKEFMCPFTGNCEITVITRRFCQKCRLEKCFHIGMVKEFIMSEKDKAEKKKKIEANRAKKRPLVTDEVSSSKQLKSDDLDISQCSSNEHSREAPANIQYDVLNSTTCSPSQRLHSPLPSQSTEGQIYYTEELTQYSDYSSKSIDIVDAENAYTSDTIYEEKAEVNMNSVLSNQEKVFMQREQNREPESVPEATPTSSTYSTTHSKARDILEDVERMPIEPNSIESILCEAIKLEFEAYSGVGVGVGVGGGVRHTRDLNDAERAKLNELIVANKALHAPIDDDMSHLVDGAALHSESGRHHPTLLTIINLTAVAIRRLIKMAKKINAFKNMCEEDQVALLKGGCTEMMVLHSTMTYDGQQKSWKIPHSREQMSSIKTEVLKLAKGNIYQAHDAFIRTFDPRWRTDEHIVLIMSAILLFTPSRPRAVHTDVIRLEQNSYYYLLRRYLESVYPGCEAKSVFLKLIQKISELHGLANNIISVYLDVNPIEPLLIEIFDLKHHAASSP